MVFLLNVDNRSSSDLLQRRPQKIVSQVWLVGPDRRVCGRKEALYLKVLRFMYPTVNFSIDSFFILIIESSSDIPIEYRC